ncbi:hypothetical protein AGR56_13605 [Clostridium sp. DMHC 10]|uniref:hypothetical protein n=1 Tax=Clostridium sp. DMHC 10 TaxID=747377 RepID=UPI00069DC7D1|nr:hypothetical protein [Clostridium sp. DMHC 10]KOF57429.1 hypothetical protein AGR56_13605 [Clostridium sp. DMHC 10]
MSKTEEFISKEKEFYGKIYSNIAFAIDDISGIIDEEDFKNRKYTSKQPILDKYIELLNSAESENKNKNKGFFKNLFKDDKYITLLEGYKADHRNELNQLEDCCNCQCLKCTAECKFDSCNRCSDRGIVAYCDHSRTNVVTYKNRILNLVNNDTGMEDRYNVLAVVQDALNDKRYILIESISNSERFILYYYPGIREDSYSEITNEEDFNFAAEAYDNL